MLIESLVRNAGKVSSCSKDNAEIISLIADLIISMPSNALNAKTTLSWDKNNAFLEILSVLDMKSKDFQTFVLPVQLVIFSKTMVFASKLSLDAFTKALDVLDARALSSTMPKNQAAISTDASNTMKTDVPHALRLSKATTETVSSNSVKNTISPAV